MSLALFAVAALATAEPASSPAAAPAPSAVPDRVTLPAELSDPKLADKMGAMVGALAKAMMDMPVGEVVAAAEGRPATRADKAKKVRDYAGTDLTDEQIAKSARESGVMMQAASKALVAALPAILQAMKSAEAEIGKAAANLPDPTYPRR